MSLHTQIIRNGDLLQLRWGDFHVAAMAIASAVDAPDESRLYDDPIEAAENARRLMDRNGTIGIDHSTAFQICMYHVLAATPVGERGSYTLKQDWCFTDNTDGERLELKAGDQLMMSRG